ncbi:MAG TPA: hypothetical protein VFQ26_08600, partial [Nitrospiraceae bacterium]|nr:hypothetical protein [Nitrospiraceae bacterium]
SHPICDNLRMLKQASSVVLTHSDPQRTEKVRLGSSFAAALLAILFEHPEGTFNRVSPNQGS